MPRTETSPEKAKAMKPKEKIIERKTPIPGEVERYVWLDGALIRIEDLEEVRIMNRWVELLLWGRFESPVPSME